MKKSIKQIVEDSERKVNEYTVHYIDKDFPGFRISYLNVGGTYSFSNITDSFDVYTPPGKYTNSLHLSADENTFLGLDENVVKIEVDGRAALYHIDYDKEIAVNNVTEALRKIYKEEFSNPLNDNTIIVNLFQNNMLKASVTFDENIRQHFEGVLDYYVRKHITHKSNDGKIYHDIFLYDEDKTGDSAFNVEASLEDFVFQNFYKDVDGVYWSDDYPFLKAFKLEDAYKLEFIKGGDYIIGKGSDNITMTSSYLEVGFGGIAKRVAIWYRDNPWGNSEDDRKAEFIENLAELNYLIKERS